MQAIPWELVFHEIVVRYTNLNHAVNREYVVCIPSCIAPPFPPRTYNSHVVVLLLLLLLLLLV
jgi:hypothetical protein